MILRRLALLICPAPAALVALTLLCLLRGSGTAAPTALPAWESPLTAPMETAPETTGSAEEEPAVQAEKWDAAVTLTALLDGEERTVTLGDYLWGVVAAEMPASFEPEALKAQVIAARTYTLYKLAHPSGNHAAQLCGDPGCCQAWMSREARREAWGADADELEQKLDAAVSETDGLAVCWEGEPIQAVFHAASAGMTRTADEVWGASLPYLQSVESPEGAEVPNYYSAVPIAAADFAAAIDTLGLGCDLSGGVENWIGETSYDAAGLPAAITIGGVSVPTTALRTLFGLRSACIALSAANDAVTAYVTGYGHGVGMSQYGANALAKEGYSAEEILMWYYTGAELVDMAG